MSFEKITKVQLPYDRRDPDPKKDYGIHGFSIFYILKGPKGATQFYFSVHVFLPHVQKDLETKSSMDRYRERTISGYDVGYHALTPQYEGQSQMDCELFPCGKCYYDGSSLRAEEWVDEIFSIRGERPDDEIWRRLENEYIERFGKPDADTPHCEHSGVELLEDKKYRETGI